MKRFALVLFLAVMALGAHAAGKASYYLQRAEEAYQQEDFDECLRFCQEGVKQNPKDGQCWAIMAEIYSKRAYARYAEALDASDKALPLLKQDKSWTAFIYAIRGDVYYKLGDYELSRKAYRTAISLAPANETYRISYADACATMEDWQETADAYRELLKINPGKTFVYAELADAEYHLGQTEQAKIHCQTAILLSDDENIKSHIVLAHMALDRHDLPTAAQEFARAMFLEQGYETAADTLLDLYPELLTAAVCNEVEKAPADMETNNTAAFYFYQLDDYTDCLYHLHKVLDVQESPEILSHLAAVYTYMNELDLAKQYYLRAQQMDSTNNVYDAELAYIYYLMKQSEEAELYYRKAINAAPSDNDNYRLLGTVLLLRDPEQALHYCDTALMLAPEKDIMGVLYSRAEALRRLGREEEAQRDLREALTYRDTPAANERALLNVNALLGDTAEVHRYADSVRLSARRDPYRMRAFASVYAALGDKDSTLAYMHRFFEQGGRETDWFRVSPRMTFLHNDSDFVGLLHRYDSIRLGEMAAFRSRIRDTHAVAGVTEIPFTRQGGVCQVQCTVNSLPFYFVFDTGASDVTLSSVEANFMLKNGYLTETDFMGKQNYITADGKIHEGTLVNLRELRVGDIVLYNIKASIVSSQTAPLLLGQTAFRHFGQVEIDNLHSVIRFTATSE
ncbi:MAG: tetratricopeptide repeat protein [Paludibacteraceae bacterium]|nr:tetratricopeptide repeat protein [Paludibacteraceae bacterium]